MALYQYGSGSNCVYAADDVYCCSPGMFLIFQKFIKKLLIYFKKIQMKQNAGKMRTVVIKTIVGKCSVRMITRATQQPLPCVFILQMGAKQLWCQ